MNINQQHPYLNRPGEHLVLEGYRHWTTGIICGEPAVYWKKTWNLYAEKLGASEGRLALSALSRFVRTLGHCAGCPLKTSPVGCQYLCRDEVMILGLLSGLQHNEETTIALCLDGLVCPKRCEEVLLAAEILATTLRTLGKTLLPVPSGTIKAILTDSVSTHTLQ